MKICNIDKVIKECDRFKTCALDAKTRLLAEGVGPLEMQVVGYKETAACRRASMDLSRALAELRRY